MRTAPCRTTLAQRPPHSAYGFGGVVRVGCFLAARPLPCPPHSAYGFGGVCGGGGFLACGCCCAPSRPPSSRRPRLCAARCSLGALWLRRCPASLRLRRAASTASRASRGVLRYACPSRFGALRLPLVAPGYARGFLACRPLASASLLAVRLRVPLRSSSAPCVPLGARSSRQQEAVFRVCCPFGAFAPRFASLRSNIWCWLACGASLYAARLRRLRLGGASLRFALRCAASPLAAGCCFCVKKT